MTPPKVYISASRTFSKHKIPVMTLAGELTEYFIDQCESRPNLDCKIDQDVFQAVIVMILG
jgi:hypothetical protein